MKNLKSFFVYSIKFEPNGSVLWSQDVVDQSLASRALAWDGSDGKEVGLQNCTLSKDHNSSLSHNELTFRPLRKGCDGHFGSLQKKDLCNVCGGDNKCLGCDQVPNSGALFGEYNENS